MKKITALAFVMVWLPWSIIGINLASGRESRLDAARMSVLFGGGDQQNGVCCYELDRCKVSETCEDKGKDNCTGAGDDEVAKEYSFDCGVAPPGTPDPDWACANHDSGIGDPAICLQYVYCTRDYQNGGCKSGAIVPNSQKSGQWLCEQSQACKDTLGVP